ncbi:MAG: response regulator [Candidatus Omnitrophica bacterium]|nr:response regulator [Candidatus Omnitrophota bacterium]
MPKKILVIDDDLEIIELLRKRLESLQYTVITAGDGAVGFNMLQEHHPDLVVLDIVMPQMDGYTFVQELKRSANFKKLPVIIITAKADMEPLFLTEGVNSCLLKPIQIQVFLNKVRELIG